MKRKITIFASYLLAFASLAWGQGPVPAGRSPILDNITFPIFTLNAVPVPGASLQVVGAPGQATWCYWAVANFQIGSVLSPLGCVPNAANTLTSSNYVSIIPFSYPGSVLTVDILATATNQAPTGACNCAVTTGLTVGGTTQQSNSLSSYTVSILTPAAFNLCMHNEVVGSASTHLLLRNCTTNALVSDLSSSGGGTIGGSIAVNQVAFGSAANTIQGSPNFTYIDGFPGLQVGTQSSSAGFLGMASQFSAFSRTLLGGAVKYFNFSNISPQGNVLGIGGSQPTMTVGQANGIDPCTNSSLVRSSNVVTATTDGSCAFLDVDNTNVHSYVTIAGADAGFNGTFQILSVNTSTNVITYAQTAGNATAVTPGYSFFGSFNSNVVGTSGQANLDSLSMVLYADTSSDGFLNAQGIRLVVGNAVGTVNTRNGGPITLKAGDGNLGNNTNGGAIVLQPGGNAGGTGSNGYVLLGSPVAFASLPACSAALEGAARPVNDSTTATYNATITGSGTNHILAYCNGTNWTAH